MKKIHPTAVVAPDAELADGVELGPGAIVGPQAVIGAGTVVGPYAQVGSYTTLGRENRLHQGAVVGSDPQDLKFHGEYSTLVVGDRNQFREFCTLNRGTANGGGTTTVGSDNLFMTGSHVAHDCHIGNHVVMANVATLAGHIRVEDHVTIGGLTPVHQFVRLGVFAFIGGGGWINMDVPPYMLVGGRESKVLGLNSVGLERQGFGAEVRQQLKDAYRLLYRAQLNVSQALGRIEAELPPSPELQVLLDFLRASTRGIIR